VFADAENLKIIKVAQLSQEEGIAYPILLGDETRILKIALDNGIDLDGIPIINPKDDKNEELRKLYGDIFFAKRQRKGMNKYEAYKAMKDRNHFGCMLVENGEVDCMISGLSRSYPDTIRPAIQIIGTEEGVSKISRNVYHAYQKGPSFPC